MPKHDYKHDYYADLELPQNASVDDIKKSFKKLARLYHPDRNPGKQEEYVPKFQAIQAAHEILTDPELRSKYDADRRKYSASGGFRPPPPRGMNPMYQTSSAYAPPPKRSATQNPRTDPYAKTTSGPERWTNFPKPPTAPKPQPPPREPRNLNNLNEAWRHVRPQRAPPPQTPPRPESAAQSQPYSDTESAYARQQKRASGVYEGFPTSTNTRPTGPSFTRSNTMRMPRKGGFDPNALDDEGPVNATGYAASHRFSFRGAPAPPEAPEPPSGQKPFQTPPRPDPLSNFKSRTADEVPFTEGSERIRTPYGGPVSGENAYFSTADIKRNTERQARTRSHERAQSRPKQSSPSAGARHRSASPGPRKPPEAPSPPRPQATAQPPPPPPGGSGNARRPFSARYSGGDTYDSSSGEETIFQGRPTAQPSASRPSKNKFQPDAAPRPDLAGMPAPPPPQNGTATAQAPPNMYANSSFCAPSMPGRTLSQQFFAPVSSIAKHKYYLNFYRSSSDDAMGASSHENRGGAQGTGIPNWAYPSSVLPPRKSQSVPSSNTVPSSSQSSSKLSETLCAVPPLPRPSTAPIGSGDKMKQDEALADLTQRPKIRLNHPFADPKTDIYSGSLYVRDMFADLYYSFSFSMPPPPPPMNNPQFKSKSDESLSARFTPGEWQQEFNQPGAGFFDIPNAANAYVPRKPQPAVKSRPSSRPPETSQRRPAAPTAYPSGVQFGVPGFTNFPPPPPGPPPNMSNHSHPQSQGHAQTHTETSSQSTQAPPPPTPGGVKFSEDEWREAFKPATFTFPPRPPSPTKRGSATIRKPRRATKTAADQTTPQKPSAAEVADEERGGKPASAGGSADDEESQNGDAMDLDEEIPSQSMNASVPFAAKEARSVPLAPNRPEWRDSTYGAAPPMPTTSPGMNRANGLPASRKSSAAGVPPTPEAPEPNPLSDLKNVAPFTQTTSDGFEGMNNDLNSALPFESKASSSNPLTADDALPIDPPQPPRAPELAPGKLTAEKWAQHSKLMTVYFAKWFHFQEKITEHFVKRQNQMQGLVGTGWLSAENGAGFEKYMISIREDVVMREWWDAACEKHVIAMEAFEKVRDRVRKGGFRSEV